MLRGRNLRTGLLVALGIATVSSGLIMALPLSLPDTWRVDSPGPPVVSEARAVAATTATPPNLDIAAAESRKVLNRSPLNATAWARLAWVADKRGDQSAMLDALDRSYVATPYWAERLVKIRQIDTHIFYRWTGSWGLPAAFTGVHAGTEPVIEKLAAVATHVEALEPALTLVEAVPDLDLTPMVILARPDDPEPPNEAIVVEEAVPEPEPVMVTTPPSAPPPVLASPLAAPRGVTPQRRARIATPR